ncbi:MAG: hypothetical protein KatS3mg118_3549 [Paracoccaceae bacterium]|nr:MAG: hypothetical protein KatS3mg118_3549 [Paracoccaceae bacterium]
MPEDDTGAPRRPPRYREILEIIRGRIRAGAYPVGGNLPSEAEFCAEFGSSRFTVREALRRLQAEGLVSRQQGAGSRVLRRTPAGRYVQAYGSLTELLQLARDTGFRRISLRHLAPPPDIVPAHRRGARRMLGAAQGAEAGGPRGPAGRAGGKLDPPAPCPSGPAAGPGASALLSGS